MFDRGKAHGPGRWAAIVLIAAAVGVAGCSVDDVLNVEDPETIDESELENASLDVIVTGAKGDFTGAYSGAGDDAFLSVTALMSDEFYSSGTFTTRTATDRRNQFTPDNGNTSDDPYLDLQFARRALGQTAAQVADQADESDSRYVELKALEGYTYVALGEAFCSAIPFSARNDGGTFDYGQPQSTENVFGLAVQRFDDALAGAGDDGSHLAAVGRARALLNAGQYQEAAAAVADVPTDWVYHIEHSVFGDDNPMYSLQENGRYSVSDVEGENGLAFRSAEDPRAPWWQDPDDETGFDENIELYKSLKYRSFDAPVVLASGVEARLIEAEAALQADQPGQMISILNDLREDVFTLMSTHVPGYAQIVLDHGWVDATSEIELDPLTDPGSDNAREDLLFEERGYWLYLTGHRLGDLRRLVTQYGRDVETVYPTGDYHKSGSYGDDVVFPLDFDEANNPDFNHDMCNVDASALAG